MPLTPLPQLTNGTQVGQTDWNNHIDRTNLVGSFFDTVGHPAPSATYVSGDYTLTALDDLLLVDTTSGPVLIGVPTGMGKKVARIKKFSFDANPVYVSSTEHIDGRFNGSPETYALTLYRPMHMVEIQRDGGSQWAMTANAYATPLKQSVAANYTITMSDGQVYVDTTAGDITITLPTGFGDALVEIKKFSFDTNHVLISSAEAIDGVTGAAAFTLEVAMQAVTLQRAPSLAQWAIL